MPTTIYKIESACDKKGNKKENNNRYIQFCLSSKTIYSRGVSRWNR